MDKPAAALAILRHALPHVPFDGWSRGVLARAALEAGYTSHDAVRVFPGGAAEAVNLWLREADNRMTEAYHSLEPPPQKIRRRIAALVRLRLEALAPHKEAMRRTLAFYALPHRAAAGLASLSRTVDAMWREAGDASADFNWYTKRLLLSGVYSSTLLYWLNDESEDHAESWAFLDRRIEDVMRIEEAKQWLRKKFPSP